MKQFNYFSRGNPIRSLWWLAVFLAATAQAERVADLRTAAQSSSDPKFVLQPEGGKRVATGICVDVNRAIERVEPTLRFVGDQDWRPVARLEAEVKAGRLDVACGMIRTKAREATLAYLEPPLFSVTYFLVARAGDDVKVNNWDDVRALGPQGVILVPHGYGPVERLREIGGLQVDAGGGDAVSSLLKLVAGRGRFYYHRSPGIESNIRKADVEGKVRVLPAVMDVQHFYMVAGKHVPPATLNKLHRALARLDGSGELKRIADHWHEQTRPAGQL